MTDNLFLVGYRRGDASYVGLQIDQTVYALNPSLSSLDQVLQTLAADELISTLLNAKTHPLETEILGSPPLNLQEIWAAGVTYEMSKEARERESGQSTIYNQVYDAPRPELFFKSMGYETVGDSQPVGIRYDAAWSVPEPELTAVLNSRLEVIGFTIGNDMSSRDIEGENPLYLPQAKIYQAACAIGPRIWLQPGRTIWPQLTIEITITRAGRPVFEGATTTAKLHRPLDSLLDYLGRCKKFTFGALLFTGTGVVPPDNFALQAEDEVQITIDPIGRLTNPVRVIGI